MLVPHRTEPIAQGITPLERARTLVKETAFGLQVAEGCYERALAKYHRTLSPAHAARLDVCERNLHAALRRLAKAKAVLEAVDLTPS